MSFDLKLENGDLKINPNGSLATVIDEVKLIQDVLKILFTPTGSHEAYPWYGSPLSTRVIGKNLSSELLVSEVKNSISYALSNLKTLQGLQEKGGQLISAREAISRVESINVSADIGDPRRIVINISIKTRSGDTVSDSFSLGI
jgi:phage gp46-like protein